MATSDDHVPRRELNDSGLAGAARGTSPARSRFYTSQLGHGRRRRPRHKPREAVVSSIRMRRRPHRLLSEQDREREGRFTSLAAMTLRAPPSAPLLPSAWGRRSHRSSIPVRGAPPPCNVDHRKGRWPFNFFDGPTLVTHIPAHNLSYRLRRRRAAFLKCLRGVTDTHLFGRCDAPMGRKTPSPIVTHHTAIRRTR